MSELLPCPFCGGEAEIYSATERKEDFMGILDAHWIADCTHCDVNIEFCDSDEDARSKWNARVKSPERTAAENALRDILDYLLQMDDDLNCVQFDPDDPEFKVYLPEQITKIKHILGEE